MTPLFVEVSLIPVIQASRATCLGQQYIVADPDSIHVVTATADAITCSCCASACAHRQVVREQQAHDATANARRTIYCDLFDLSYGD